MNLALAMSLHDHGSQSVETETSDIIRTSLSEENEISAVDKVKYLLEDQIESTEDLNKGNIIFTSTIRLHSQRSWRTLCARQRRPLDG